MSEWCKWKLVYTSVVIHKAGIYQCCHFPCWQGWYIPALSISFLLWNTKLKFWTPNVAVENPWQTICSFLFFCHNFLLFFFFNFYFSGKKKKYIFLPRFFFCWILIFHGLCLAMNLEIPWDSNFSVDEFIFLKISWFRGPWNFRFWS